MIGAVVVWLAFGYFARGVNWLGDPGNAAGWTDQAAQYGIVAVPVALLMIGGEFDLSAGVMIGSSGLLLGYLATHAHMNIWPAIASCSRSAPLSASSTATRSYGRSCRASSSRSRRSSSCKESTLRSR
jgi:ribose/xylose/arabinose/galactoside ABC-type transport system permease subunit